MISKELNTEKRKYMNKIPLTYRAGDVTGRMSTHQNRDVNMCTFIGSPLPRTVISTFKYPCEKIRQHEPINIPVCLSEEFRGLHDVS